jgi:hypothetical protein
MDRFQGEVKMDAPVSYVPRGKAALASSRAKAGVVTACILLGVYLYGVQERQHAAAAGAVQALPHEMEETLAQLAARNEDAAAAQVRKAFYDKQADVYCGEVNGTKGARGELRSPDGVRIFVCGPGPH